MAFVEALEAEGIEDDVRAAEVFHPLDPQLIRVHERRGAIGPDLVVVACAGRAVNLSPL